MIAREGTGAGSHNKRVLLRKTQEAMPAWMLALRLSRSGIYTGGACAQPTIPNCA